jgi:hypothetical protein
MRSLSRCAVSLTVFFCFWACAGAEAATWGEQSAPLLSGASEGELRGVSCFSAGICTAVGHAFKEGKWGAMGDEWNGTEWKTASVVWNPGLKNGNLWSVDCYSEKFCTAAGAFGDSGGNGNTLVESRNKKGEWSRTESPNPSGSAPELLAVDCVSGEFCLSTGKNANTKGEGQIIAEYYEPMKWTVMTPIANPGGQKNGKLWGVACTSETSCRAVGNWGTTAGIGVPGSEFWNGETWTATQLPEPGAAEFGELLDISCPGANSCLAVGEWREAFSSNFTIFTDYWNGSGWSYEVPPRPVGTTESVFKGVSCWAAKHCIAVGSYRDSKGKEQTLAEIWNGEKEKERWTIQATPNPTGALASRFEAISCPESEVCEAVGTYLNGSSQLKPLAAKFK